MKKNIAHLINSDLAFGRRVALSMNASEYGGGDNTRSTHRLFLGWVIAEEKQPLWRSHGSR